ncbi:MAG TPA: hypothetical protein VII74_09205, partial [Chthoniobacterales bacterium]
MPAFNRREEAHCALLMKISFLFLLVFALVATTGCDHKTKSRVHLTAGLGSASFEAPDRFDTALVIVNEGSVNAK